MPNVYNCALGAKFLRFSMLLGLGIRIPKTIASKLVVNLCYCIIYCSNRNNLVMSAAFGDPSLLALFFRSTGGRFVPSFTRLRRALRCLKNFFCWAQLITSLQD